MRTDRRMEGQTEGPRRVYIRKLVCLQRGRCKRFISRLQKLLISLTYVPATALPPKSKPLLLNMFNFATCTCAQEAGSGPRCWPRCTTRPPGEDQVSNARRDTSGGAAAAELHA